MPRFHGRFCSRRDSPRFGCNLVPKLGSIWFNSVGLESTFYVSLVFFFESESETRTADIFFFGTACRGKIGKFIPPFFLPEGTGIATVEIGRGKAQITVVGD